MGTNATSRLNRRRFARRAGFLSVGLSAPLFAGTTAAAAQETNGEHVAALQTLLDRVQIVETTTRMGTLADAKAWDELVTVFADEVDLDYTAFVGGEPARLAPADLVAAWQGGMSGWQATQHLVSNHVVTIDGDEAECTASFQAQHFLPNETGGSLWTLGGNYSYGLVRADSGWKINAVTMVPTWGDGNQLLATLAAEEPAS